MKTIIIDDDRLAALSLKTILEADGEISVEATGGSGEDAIRLYSLYRPDVMLMDIRMGKMDGIEAGEIILKSSPEAKILYLTTFSDDEYIIKALNMGAKGYILKQDFESIAAALKAVAGGQSVFGDKIINRLPGLIKTTEKFDFEKHGINSKEKEILELVAKGFSNREIAEELFLGEGTVRNYISSLLDKLELRDRTQLAVYWHTEIKG